LKTPWKGLGPLSPLTLGGREGMRYLISIAKCSWCAVSRFWLVTKTKVSPTCTAGHGFTRPPLPVMGIRPPRPPFPFPPGPPGPPGPRPRVPRARDGRHAGGLRGPRRSLLDHPARGGPGPGPGPSLRSGAPPPKSPYAGGGGGRQGARVSQSLVLGAVSACWSDTENSSHRGRGLSSPTVGQEPPRGSISNPGKLHRGFMVPHRLYGERGGGGKAIDRPVFPLSNLFGSLALSLSGVGGLPRTAQARTASPPTRAPARHPPPSHTSSSPRNPFLNLLINSVGFVSERVFICLSRHFFSSMPRTFDRDT